MKHLSICVLVFAVASASIFVPTKVQAGEFNIVEHNEHYEERSKDMKKMLELVDTHIHNDILESVKTMFETNQTSGNCLESVLINFDTLDAEFVENAHLMGLAIYMSDELDEMYVYDALDENMDSILKSYSNLRKTVNQMVGFCSKSATINSYGQEIKKYIEQATPVVESIKKRIAAENANLSKRMDNEAVQK